MRTRRFKGALLSALLVTSLIASLSIATLSSTSQTTFAQENEYFMKECMPDLGQHSVNWCWAAAAANSIYWWSQHGYPELIDDPADPTPNDNSYITDPLLPHPPPPPCPGVYRLLHEIAIDCLFPGLPENTIGIDNTYCQPILDVQYFHGLQEFIDEQGAPLLVHEIVDNENVWMPPPPIDNIVIYRPPTLEDYQRELKRCQDVLLWLNFRHYYEGEDTDHVVTGVGFTYNNMWITVSDPWTVGAPDHGNDLHHAPENNPYENLPVWKEDPLWVIYAGFPVQVSKLVYISPIEEEENCGVEVTIDPKYQDGSPCEYLTYYVTVHNTGTVVDNFLLSVVPNGWPMENIWLEPTELVNIPPCENKVAKLIVHVPEWEEHCHEKEIVVTAESEFCGATDNDNAIAHVVVPTCDVDVTIEPKHKRGTPCDWLTFVVSVHNTGDVPDNYLLWVVPDGWPMDNIYLEDVWIPNVNPCETVTTLLHVHVPKCVVPCTHKEIVVVAESEFCGATDNDTALVQVVSKYLHNIEPGHVPLPPDNWMYWTLWHEIYPVYCQYYYISSWKDNNQDGVVSPCDTIDMTNLDNGEITWYHVKDVTCTLVLELEEGMDPETWWYLEHEDGWESYCQPWHEPLGSQWNEIRPVFCNRYLLIDWIDSQPDGMLGYCDWVWLVDKVTWEPLPFPLHVVELVTDLVLCEENVEPWTGTATFGLENLYKVSLEKNLWLSAGSKLVVKFYRYDNVTLQDNSVIENIVPIQHVKDNENVPHPREAEGFPWGTVQIAKLVLTTDNTANEISELASFTVHQSHLRNRFIEILMLWFGNPGKQPAYRAEIIDILMQWFSAPP